MKPLIGMPTRALARDDILFYSAPATYTHALELAGGAPVLIPLNLGEETLRAIFARLDGLLLHGGVDIHPKEFGEAVEPFCGEIDAARDAVELRLTRWALYDQKPILGICRGIQMLNVAAGGSLYQDTRTQLGNVLDHAHRPGERYNRLTHSIEINPDSELARALGTTHLDVNSLHHQSLKEIAPGFHVTARAPDGVVEGIEADTAPSAMASQFALGVQFHPEWLVEDDARMVGLFREFVQAAGKK
jgi:putative glutamine amidotransferase